jgi:hypothetical protein
MLHYPYFRLFSLIRDRLYHVTLQPTKAIELLLSYLMNIIVSDYLYATGENFLDSYCTVIRSILKMISIEQFFTIELNAMS